MSDISSIKINDILYNIKDKVARETLSEKQDKLTFDLYPTKNSYNPVTSNGVYIAMNGVYDNFDELIPSLLTKDNYTSVMRHWFNLNNASEMTDFTSLCDRWYSITRTGWTGGTQFYHANISMTSEGTKVGDNFGLTVIPSTNTQANQDDYQNIPLFHCLDCNWFLDENSKLHITAIDGVCGNFERYNPEKFVGVIQMTGWYKYVDDVENGTYTYMYTDDIKAEGYAPLPEAINLDGTIRTWVVHGKYLSGNDRACFSGTAPLPGGYNTILTSYHTKWGNQYGGKTSADDAFLKLMFFLKYGSLTADNILNGCVSYNYQYTVAETETNVERVILTSAQAKNIRIGSTVIVGNPTEFSSNTPNINRAQASMSEKVNRKKVIRKETLSSDKVAVYIDNDGITFDTTANTSALKNIGPTASISINDANEGAVLIFSVNIEPIQSGTGTPSPNNIRPITGWTKASFSINGNDTNVSLPLEAGTVYGGILDIVNGILTVDTAMITLNGSENWSSLASESTTYVYKLNDALGKDSVLISNMYNVTTNGTTESSCFIDENKSFHVNSNISTIAEFKTFLQNNNLQVVYKIAVPITYNLSPQQITLLQGSNTLSADCGKVILQYSANVLSQTYISTSPWFTGTCDSVKGVDGSPTTPSGSSEPFILQGIECGLGGYELLSDTIIKYYKNANDIYRLAYYICRDASKYSNDITTDYNLINYEIDCPSEKGWYYISEYGRDSNFPEVFFPYLIECTSSQRMKDGVYLKEYAESLGIYLSFGALTSGAVSTGLSSANLDYNFISNSWLLLFRLSATGNRGVYNGGEG